MFSIIVLTHLWPSRISQCLDSLCKIEGDFITEVIIVNDGGPDIIKDVVAKYEPSLPVKYIKNLKNEGVGFSRNVGIKAAKGKYISFFADNYSIPKDYFSKASSFLVNYDVVASKVVTKGKGIAGKIIDNYFQLIIERWKQDATKVGDGYEGEGFPAGSASSFKKSVFDAVGFFDTSLKTGEDSDYNARMDKQNKKRIYVPDIIVIRTEHGSLGSVLRKHFRYGKDFYISSKKKNRVFIFREELLYSMYITKEYFNFKKPLKYFLFFLLMHLSFRLGQIDAWRRKRK